MRCEEVYDKAMEDVANKPLVGINGVPATLPAMRRVVIGVSDAVEIGAVAVVVSLVGLADEVASATLSLPRLPSVIVGP